mgnify:CR=1 FL=1
MISLEGLVGVIVFLLIAALVLGLLWWLIGYVESQGLGPPVIFKVIRVIFVILIVLLCIGALMQLAGHPIVRW